jgi:tRNA G10  N-methylase Trm11
MNYVLIPGKNWKLSLAELILFLESREVEFKILAFSREFFAIQIEWKDNALDAASLGGNIKIGLVNKVIPTELFEKTFVQKDREARSQLSDCISANNLPTEMIEKASAKYHFGVSVYCSAEALRPLADKIQRFIGSTVKSELSEREVRSEFMGFPRDRSQPQLTHVEVLKKKLVENKAEILACIGKTQTWFGRTTSVHDPFEFQKRDIGKPNQRAIFAIPPRLARIMVNLSGCVPGKTLLDPFCGVGTILQEALLSKAEVIGIDSNSWCVEAAIENLEWLSREYALRNGEFRVLKGDTLRLNSIVGSNIDCIVTEPDLGPALKDVPTSAYAQKIIDNLTPLFYGFLEQAHDVLKKGGRLVLVTPCLKTRSGKPIAMRTEKKAQEVGFEMVYPFGTNETFKSYDYVKEDMRITRRFIDMAERHKTGREIHVFQK